MFIAVPSAINWGSIKSKTQEAIYKSNERENLKRIHFQYEKGELTTEQKPGILRELSVPRPGPYEVLKYHTNSDITFG